MKRTRLFSVALLAAAWLAGSTAQAWDEPEQIDGVYQIGTASELEWFSDYVGTLGGGTFLKAVLTADLDFTGITHKPIGINDQAKFWGTFDGQGHRIKNMTAFSQTNPVGLFGGLREMGNDNTRISNVIIDSSCRFTGENYVGAIAGYTQNAQGNNAGIAVVIENCVNEADVQATNGAASGILGACKANYAKLVMTNCVNRGNVQGTSTATALSGWINNSDGTYTNCYNTGRITCSTTTGNGAYNMTVFGSNGGTRKLVNCYDLNESNNRVQGKKEDWSTADPVGSGELCFYLNGQTNGGTNFYQTIGDDLFPIPFSTSEKVYEVADYYCDGTPKGAVVYSNTEGGVTIDDHVKGDNYICVNCNNYAFEGIEDYKTPDDDGYYHLATVEEVEWFSAMVNKKYHGAMKVKLDADIDFGGVPNAHHPIGTSAHKFGGTFDGQGHRIKGMVITTDIVMENRAFDGVGFFGSVRGGNGDPTWETENTDVVIENLIIDASCSIEYDNHWVAGIVGHINSKQDGGSVTISNCGNEANINAVENANAGIIGIVESTALPLTIVGCWNTGNITGTGANIAGIFGGNSGSQATVTIKNCWNEGDISGNKENGAITGWIGSNSGNSITGCYNIGQVTGIEGSKSLYRGTATASNLYDIMTPAQEGTATLITKEMVSTGELCYLLNGDQSDIQWTQTMDGTQDKPLPDATGDQVYAHGNIYCSGESAPGTIYNNEGPDGVVYLPHHFNDEIGMCDVCYTQFQEPALVDGYYEIKNAGNLEWFSERVNVVGDLQINGKLMNDIDLLNVENLHSPIGPNTDRKYNGTFDGQGFRIKNMIIERPFDSNIGFFGFLRGNAANTTVKNLIIDKSCTIHGYNRVGGITGSCQNNGALITLENIINEATVIAEHQDAAGIIGGQEGNAPKWYIHNVLNTGTVTAKNEAPYAGALCCFLGNNSASVIENFVNLGTINGHRGGNIGRIFGTRTNIIDLSDTDFDSSVETNYGLDSGLTKEDIANGKLAYTVGWGQLLGTDAYPTPLYNTEVSYVGDAGYATLYDTTTGYELNGDVEAYVATAKGTWLELAEIENVPAGTPVVLKGSYYNKLAAELPAINVANDLKGTETATEADGTMYILAQKDDEVGFYRAESGTTIPAGKAYYQSTSGVKAFFFAADDATGISLTPTLSEGEGAVYNLAGQRIQKIQQGINIINGKKVLK